MGCLRFEEIVFIIHPFYKYFYSLFIIMQKDLDNTIGAAAGIGASGVVIWGNRWDENTSPHVCQRINSYVQDTLGPYIQKKMKEVINALKKFCQILTCSNTETRFSKWLSQVHFELKSCHQHIRISQITLKV